MGTRSTVKWYNANKDGPAKLPAYVMYRQFDGYPRVAGADLYNFLIDSGIGDPSSITQYGEAFYQECRASGEGHFDKLNPLATNNQQEWNYGVWIQDGKFMIRIERYGDITFIGDMDQFKAVIRANGGEVNEKSFEPPAEVDDKTETLGKWESPDVGICQSVPLEHRDEWFNELVGLVRKDPTVSFIGSGDRVMIAEIQEVKNGMAYVNFEDCLITRRRFAQIKTDWRGENTVSKSMLSSVLADVTNHLSTLVVNKMTPDEVMKWKDEMKGWLEEINQLTLAEPKE